MTEGQKIVRRALNLTLAIYRLTDRLPRNEFLSGRLRELSSELVGDLAVANFQEAREKIIRLLVFFKISQEQNWVNPLNWRILSSEYKMLQHDIILKLAKRDKEEESPTQDIMSHNIRKEVKIPRVKLESLNQKLNQRHKKIMEFLEENGPKKISEIIPLFNNQISERTLRNELAEMVKQKMIKKRGFNKTTEYYL